MHTPKQNPFDALQIQDDACDDDDFDDSHLFTVIILILTLNFIISFFST